MVSPRNIEDKQVEAQLNPVLTAANRQSSGKTNNQYSSLKALIYISSPYRTPSLFFKKKTDAESKKELLSVRPLVWGRDEFQGESCLRKEFQSLNWGIGIE